MRTANQLNTPWLLETLDTILITYSNFPSANLIGCVDSSYSVIVRVVVVLKRTVVGD